MKNNIALFLSVLAFVLSAYAAFGPRNGSTQTGAPSIFKDRDQEKEQPEIADFMLYIQHFHHKLYLSARAGNAGLCQFYLHEIGEKMKALSDANIWSNGINISLNMRTYGLSQVDLLLTKDPRYIYENFDNFTQSCNGCHAASKHPDIRIKTPVNTDFPNQDFNP